MGCTADAPTTSSQALLQERMHASFDYILMRPVLSSEDAADLKQRGIPPEIAESCGLRTWPGGILKLPSYDVKRISSSCKHLSRSYGFVQVQLPPCMVIPARNPEGLIPALQINPHRDARRQIGESDLLKYLWASKHQSFKALCGDIPLFVCMPAGTSGQTEFSEFALIEGGLKAHELAMLMGRIYSPRPTCRSYSGVQRQGFAG